MSDRLTPEEIRRPSFRVAFRGYDQNEVAARLDELATAIEELRNENERLTSRLGEFANRDLKSEFEAVSKEVGQVLEAAREAAQAMRDRATADAARWRSEAMAEVDAARREARADAESMRMDAWTTGTQLLEQVEAEVSRQREELERNALAVMGESEREAHRLTSSARREAEDLVRTAKMDAERMLTQARADHDDIIARAHRQAEAAQERTQALEERRRQLMDEVESVREALASVQGELEERRHGIGLSEPPELPGKMLMLNEEGDEVEGWENGGTVRVIRPTRPEPEGAAEPEPEATAEPEMEPETEPETEPEESADETTAEPEPAEVELVESILEDVEETVAVEAPDSDPVSEPHEPAAEDADVEEVEPEAVEPEAVEPEAVGPAPTPADEKPASNGRDDVFDLFRRLREPETSDSSSPDLDTPEAGEEPEGEPEQASEEAENDDPDLSIDPFETRERLLLPITNASLRSVKRALTEAQNQTLEEIRVSGGNWEPVSEELGSVFQEEFDSLADQASQAGVEAAMEMGLGAVGNLEPLASPPDVAADLTAAVTAAVQSAGSGSRERQAAASRVFRGWRTDEAERRIRAFALTAYHEALRHALENQDHSWRWISAGRLCPVCRNAAESADSVPPAHRDCSCTIVPI